MPLKENEYYYATSDEYFGKGNTLKEAYDDLKENGPRGVEEDSVVFGIGRDISVSLQFVEDIL